MGGSVNKQCNVEQLILAQVSRMERNNFAGVCKKGISHIFKTVNMDKFLGPSHFKDQADSQHKYYQKSTQFAKMSKKSLIPKSS
ncbi:hypothetical protein H5410_032033 [Solanum commersonii]|uniref:Uncharacterized protein n=1 Tax=Solanum commersonii TaxID=4109 RepID=A0A9J5YLQ1_SOLCO|nr:hypothetical protein H5410_032033 [Solanum commersonii]